MLIEVLLTGENERTSELPAAHQSPVFIKPACTLLEIFGDLLKGHYVILVVIFNSR
jgi:hypothetical protein